MRRIFEIFDLIYYSLFFENWIGNWRSLLYLRSGTLLEEGLNFEEILHLEEKSVQFEN